MKAREALIAWTPARMSNEPTHGHAGVFPWPDPRNLSGRFVYWAPAHSDKSNKRGIKQTKWETRAWLLCHFNTMVVRDGVDPVQAHSEMLKIDEYRDFIAPDCPGVREATVAAGLDWEEMRGPF